MKNRLVFIFLLILLFAGCQVTEIIHIKEDRSGNIEIIERRDEQSYMQLAGENYSKEEKFVDTTYVFKDFITKYAETFLKLTPEEKAVFQKFENANVHIKQSSIEKEFCTTISQNFKTVEEVPDLLKTGEYASDIQHNYALSAEEHYYSIRYTFDGSQFKRIVKITDTIELQKQRDRIVQLKTQLSKIKINQTYVLKYYFPRKIKSVSNSDAKISEDKKSLELQFLLSDCLQNPEITNLEVFLE